MIRRGSAADDEVREDVSRRSSECIPQFRRERRAGVPRRARARRARDFDARLLAVRAAARSARRSANVFIVNSAQIANGTLNVNETIGLAARQAVALAPLIRPGAGPRRTGRTARRSRPPGARPHHRPGLQPREPRRERIASRHDRLPPPRERVARRRQSLVVHEDAWRRRVGGAPVVSATCSSHHAARPRHARLRITFFVVGCDAAVPATTISFVP